MTNVINNKMGKKNKERTITALRPVYPSKKETVFTIDGGDGYDGAHYYKFIDSYGHVDGEPLYAENLYEFHTLQFVQKTDGEETVGGVQTEQLLICLIDRQTKLDKAFPCPENKLILKHLKAALDAQESKVRDRLNRGVMGKLKK